MPDQKYRHQPRPTPNPISSRKQKTEKNAPPPQQSAKEIVDFHKGTGKIPQESIDSYHAETQKNFWSNLKSEIKAGIDFLKKDSPLDDKK